MALGNRRPRRLPDEPFTSPEARRTGTLKPPNQGSFVQIGPAGPHVFQPHDYAENQDDSDVHQNQDRAMHTAFLSAAWAAIFTAPRLTAACQFLPYSPT